MSGWPSLYFFDIRGVNPAVNASGQTSCQRQSQALFCIAPPIIDHILHYVNPHNIVVGCAAIVPPDPNAVGVVHMLRPAASLRSGFQRYLLGNIRLGVHMSWQSPDCPQKL